MGWWYHHCTTLCVVQVEQVVRHPSDFLVAGFVSLSQRSYWTISRSGQSVEGAVEPDAGVKTPWASVVDH